MNHLQSERKYASDVAFTPSVKKLQSVEGSREMYERVERGHGWETTVTPQLEAFVAELDMFYLGTATAQGQPYIQYRGGPRGFLRVVDHVTLGFADFGGNRQFISAGNLAENPRSFLFLIDYVNRRRTKVWGTASVADYDPDLLDRLTDADYHGRPERAILFHIDAWDVNCPQHIHQRLPADAVTPVIEQLQSRIRELESQLKLRSDD